MDTIDSRARSAVMARIRSEDTGPEWKVRRFLHRRGLRYRLHGRDLPGKPDLVFPKWRVVVFVNGCFWHGHVECGRHRLPKTRREYWLTKIDRNRARDATNSAALIALGWRPLTIWECELSQNGLENLWDQILRIGNGDERPSCAGRAPKDD